MNVRERQTELKKYTKTRKNGGREGEREREREREREGKTEI
jgi:hypothetical protein